LKGLTLKLIGILLGISALLFLYAGCSLNKQHSTSSEMIPRQNFAALPVAQPAEPSGFAPDSLWNDQLPFGALYSDSRARGVNDIITILIVESTTAENSASTSGAKKSEIKAGIPAFFGHEAELVNRFRFPKNANASSLLSANLDKTFSGDGKTARSGTIITTVSARVIRVLPNGNLVILGQREISINNEKETIFVSGIIRRSDIHADNTITSTKIADARIFYGGKGQVSEEQRAGWAGRIISVLWPF